MGLEGIFKWCYARNVRERRIACSRVFVGYVGFGHFQSPSWKEWTDLSWFCFLDMLDFAVLWPHYENQAFFFLESAKGINDAFSWYHMYKGHNNKHQNYPQLLSPCISEILSGFCPPVICHWCLVFLFASWLEEVGGWGGGGRHFGLPTGSYWRQFGIGCIPLLYVWHHAVKDCYCVSSLCCTPGSVTFHITVLFLFVLVAVVLLLFYEPNL